MHYARNVGTERDLPGCAHVDGCAGWSVPLKNSPLDAQWSQWLVLRLPRMDRGLIATCWVNLNKGKANAESVIAAGVEFQLEGDVAKKLSAEDVFSAPTDKKTGLPAGGKCVALQKRWAGAVTNNFGHMHLAIRVPPRMKDGAWAHSLALTHVITL